MEQYYTINSNNVMRRNIPQLNPGTESILYGEVFEQPALDVAAMMHGYYPYGVSRAVARPDSFWGWNPIMTLSLSSSIPEWGLAMLMDCIEEIQQYADIRIVRLTEDNHTAMIRVANVGDGSWSYVGTDNLMVNKSLPTMNLSTLKGDEPAIDVYKYKYARYTCLHEVCHMLGLKHSQDNPLRPFTINVSQIVLDTGMTEEQVRNVYDSIGPDVSLSLSEFDGDSIMLYPLSEGWIHPYEGTPSSYEMKYELSSGDKRILTDMFPEIYQVGGQ